MFSPEERQVYRCPFTNRAYDPLAVKRALQDATAGRFSALVAEKNQGALLTAARKALSLKPVDPDTGEGWLDAVVWDALCAFTGYLKGKGQRAPRLPEASPCSDGPGNLDTKIGSP